MKTVKRADLKKLMIRNESNTIVSKVFQQNNFA